MIIIEAIVLNLDLLVPRKYDTKRLQIYQNN
jgi:hypothetical protein